MKLELKHLAPYLPYGLKVIYNNETESSNIRTIDFGSGTYEDCKIAIDFNDGEHIWMFKPILRPLSDLTEDEVYKEKYNFNSDFLLLVCEGSEVSTYNTCYDDILELFKHHFDVFGLLDKGLAIDVNTIPK